MLMKVVCFLSLAFAASAQAQLYPWRGNSPVPYEIIDAQPPRSKLVQMGDERMAQILQTLPMESCQVSVTSAHGYFYVALTDRSQTLNFVIPKTLTVREYAGGDTAQFYFISADAPAKPALGDARLAIEIRHRGSFGDIYVFRHTFASYDKGTIVKPNVVNGWVEPHVQRPFRDDDTRDRIMSCSFSKHRVI